ncbi:MAG: hypothetical protein U0930_06945 [Pirellulales bacterium]
MNDLFVAFAAAFFVPLLFQSSKVAILGLAVQGVLLAMVPASHVHEWNAQLILECGLLVVLRSIVAPILIYRNTDASLKGQEFSLIGKNIFQWTIAGLLMASAYFLGNNLAPESREEALQVGTAAGCILIGMLILSNQSSRLGQVIGLLTIESGMALVELLSPHAMPLPVSLGVNVVYVFLLLTIRIYLKQPSAEEISSSSKEDEVVA